MDPDTDREQEYWLSPKEKYVRPYAICIKKCEEEEDDDEDDDDEEDDDMDTDEDENLPEDDDYVPLDPNLV